MITTEQIKESFKEAFAFNKFGNGEDFENHIRNSIPNYEGMRSLIVPIAKNFVMENENVYDLGTSSGDLLCELDLEMDKKLGLSYTGYDIAENLMPIEAGRNLNFYKRDVTDDSLKLFNTSLIFSLFTLQFIDLDKRVKLIQKVYDSLSKRGCFLVCEKIYSSEGITEDIFTFSNYESKIVNGLCPNEILTKQTDLKSIMKPLTQIENEQLFKDAGFRVVEVFFKSLNFIGWVLIK